MTRSLTSQRPLGADPQSRPCSAWPAASQTLPPWLLLARSSAQLWHPSYKQYSSHAVVVPVWLWENVSTGAVKLTIGILYVLS